MPRRRSPRPRPAPLRGLPAATREETGADGVSYQVCSISAARATKTYRCPGCDQEIRVGVAHVVAWATETGGVDDRRHWHTPCWAHRERRRPTRSRW